MSFFGSKKTPDEHISVIFDIESGLVRGSLVLFKRGRVPSILAVYTADIEHKKVNPTSGRHEDILTALEEVAQVLVEEGIARLDPVLIPSKKVYSIHYVLSSPWVLSMSKTLKKHFNKPTRVSSKDVTTLLTEERKRFEEVYREGKFEDTFEYDLLFIEEKIVEIRLNGYTVPAIYPNSEVENIDVTYIAGITSASFIKKMKRSVDAHIHAHREEIHSSLLLQYDTLRRLTAGHSDYLWLHVHGGVTDVIGILHGVPRHISSFPFGLSTFLDTAGAQLNVSTQIADSMLALHEQGNHDGDHASKVAEIIRTAQISWKKSLIESLQEMTTTVAPPSTICLWSEELSDTFKRAIDIPTPELPSVLSSHITFMPISYEALDPFVTFYKKTQQNMLVGLYTIALNDVIW